MILDGQAAELFDGRTFQACQHNSKTLGFEWDTDRYYPAVYPPMHYALFAPLAALPYRIATMLWIAVLWAAVFVSAYLIALLCEHERGIGQRETASQGLWQRYLWIAIVLFPSVHISVLFGQKSALWLLIACVTCYLLQRNRQATAGLIFGLLSLKPTLFFLLPLLMVRHGRWRFVAGTGISVACVWGLALVSLPWSMWTSYFATLQNATSYGAASGYRVDWACNLFAIANALPVDWITWGKTALCVPLFLYVLLCVFQTEIEGICPELILIAFLGTFLISPHAYHYDLSILILPVLWISVRQPQRGVIYFALLSIAIAVSSQVMETLRVPVIAIVLLGLLSELRLRDALARTVPSSDLPRTKGSLFGPAAGPSCG